MEEEWITVVDDEDNVVGAALRAEVLRLRKNFRVVHVFLVNSRRELLIHQLAAGRGEYSGHWGSSVAGTVKAGEAPSAAAARELREELGVDLPIRQVGRVAVDERGARKFLYLFAASYDGEVRPDPAEISLIDFVPVEQVHGMIERRERAFTPTFQTALALFMREVVS